MSPKNNERGITNDIQLICGMSSKALSDVLLPHPIEKIKTSQRPNSRCMLITRGTQGLYTFVLTYGYIHSKVVVLE